MFDVIRFGQNYKLDFRTSGSQISQGWVGFAVCPFCGKESYGFAIHAESGKCNCWRCGSHGLIDTIKGLIGIDYYTAKDITIEYQTRSVRSFSSDNEADRVVKTICEYACDTHVMKARHKAYLESRNYDPDKLEREWGLMGTGNMGNYKFRIVAPIMYRGKMVSYTCRDITNKSELKWKTCEAINEVIPHKNILYGLDHCRSKSCLVIEGPGDVWRMGYGSVGTFGTAFKLQQAMLLAERFEQVFIMYDPEAEAQQHAHELGVLLAARRVEVEILMLDCGDPGEMKQDDADALMKELNLR